MKKAGALRNGTPFKDWDLPGEGEVELVAPMAAVEHQRSVGILDARAWMDTINVARGETVRIAVRQERPGLHMYHCHILDHEYEDMVA